ncbi:MAG: hypothetical protein ACK54C_15245 [Betaproteobacteria bacterium]
MLIVIALILATAFLSSTAVGLVVSFSPVPFWDMWDGYLNFYVRVSDGDYTAWWDKHVDHRIIFSRVFFWIDLKFLNGTTKALVILNVILALAIAAALVWLSRNILESAEARWIFGLSAVAAMISWVQWQNLAWAFQSQMFAANLLPLLAGVCLLTAASQGGSGRWFVGACLLGVASAYTMKNGMVALPLLSLLALALRLGWRSAIVLALLGLFVVGTYVLESTSGMPEPAELGPTAFFLANPEKVALFFVRLIGAPFVGTAPSRESLAAVVGATFCLVLAVATICGVRRRALTQSQLVCLMMIGYCLITVVGISISRIEQWGAAYAFTSRYTTNTICLWLTASLYLYPFLSRALRFRVIAQAVFLALPIGLLPVQAAAVRQDPEIPRARLISALALELQIKDKEQIEQVFPWSDIALDLAKTPSSRNIGIFDHPALRDAAISIGEKVEHEGISCEGSIEDVMLVADDAEYFKIRGWAADPYSSEQSTAWVFLDESRRVVGFGIGGFRRQSPAGIIGRELLHAVGFVGYVRADLAGREVIVKGRDSNCELAPIKLHPPSGGKITPLALSDDNWTRGVARNWGPALLVLAASVERNELEIGRTLFFEDGTSRAITRIDLQGGLAILHLDGAWLDGARVGYPRSVTAKK